MPSQQPDYRSNRPHRDFLVNLKLPPQRVKAALRSVWNATENLVAVPRERIESLVRERYALASWNERF